MRGCNGGPCEAELELAANHNAPHMAKKCLGIARWEVVIAIEPHRDTSGFDVAGFTLYALSPVERPPA